MTALAYLSGFGNEHATEALAGALPQGQNSPQRPPLGLYAEQVSGTPFTVPRHAQRRSWLYRIHPSARHPAYRPLPAPALGGPFVPPGPNRMRWNPLSMPDAPADFVDGLFTLAAGTGIGVHLYAANTDMRRVLRNADGEMLIVPQQGRLAITTECGRMEVAPGEIAVLPRGLALRIALPDGAARGYIAENHGASLRLPELGPLGANGLANPRDFLAPVAWFEDRAEATEIVHKFAGGLWGCTLDHSPFDVVAWHGTLAPCKYDLARFMAVGTVSFDHPDPSIFTVLTSPSDTPGTANLDFVIFPPRWMVAEHTFRPPWFHRNVMNEFMGLIHGTYDAKAEGFLPGGASLHPMMSAHGPDAATTERAMAATLAPHKIDGALAFMFETRDTLAIAARAMAAPLLQADYDTCWDGLARHFTGAAG